VQRILLPTLFYTALAHLPGLASQWAIIRDQPAHQAYGWLTGMLTLTFFSSLIWVYATSSRRWIFWVTQIPLAAVSIVAIYLWAMQQVMLTPDVIAVVLETTGAGARECADPNVWIAAAMGAVLAFAVGFLIPKQKPERYAWGPWVAVLLVLVISAVPALRLNSLVLPYTLFHQLLLQAHDNVSIMLFGYKVRDDITLHRTSSEPVTVVVVLGEALRADHLGINGYVRNTTPKLAKRKDIVSYQHVRSCAAYTRYSLPCLMTEATESNMEIAYERPSFVGVMRAAGFDTTWLGTQGDQSFTHRYFRFGRDAIHYRFTNTTKTTIHSHDRDLLPWLQESLNDTPAPRLIVLHTLGSHWKYHRRYHETEAKFTPVCTQNLPYLCDQQDLINSYDNTVVYTDGFLDDLIGLLEDIPAFFLYVSDHGESLGENGEWLHGKPEVPEQRHIPMIVWASEGWRKLHPERYQNIMSKRDEKLSHDNVFHTVLDCMDIEADFVDRSLSLCYNPAK
jgi:glucan phosphoethanolaminetransferase (alkaline phosphatase superfamily)